MVKVKQIPALFLPKRGVHDQKAPVNKIPAVKNNNNTRSPNVKKANDVKSPAYILRTMQETTDIKRISGIR
jgi:hypothetical protein